MYEVLREHRGDWGPHENTFVSLSFRLCEDPGSKTREDSVHGCGFVRFCSLKREPCTYFVSGIREQNVWEKTTVGGGLERIPLSSVVLSLVPPVSETSVEM